MSIETLAVWIGAILALALGLGIVAWILRALFNHQSLSHEKRVTAELIRFMEAQKADLAQDGPGPSAAPNDADLDVASALSHAVQSVDEKFRPRMNAVLHGPPSVAFGHPTVQAQPREHELPA
jgi:hypothetical protein